MFVRWTKPGKWFVPVKWKLIGPKYQIQVWDKNGGELLFQYQSLGFSVEDAFYQIGLHLAMRVGSPVARLQPTSIQRPCGWRPIWKACPIFFDGREEMFWLLLTYKLDSVGPKANRIRPGKLSETR